MGIVHLGSMSLRFSANVNHILSPLHTEVRVNGRDISDRPDFTQGTAAAPAADISRQCPRGSIMIYWVFRALWNESQYFISYLMINRVDSLLLAK